MGLLNAVAAGLGGAATSLADSYGKRNVAIEEDRLMKERARLDTERLRTVAQLQEEFAIKGETRKREAAITEGREIDAAVADMQNERISKKVYADEGPNLSSEDVHTMRSKPGGSRIDGLLHSTRQTDLEDKADVAAKLGYRDSAKGYREEAKTEAQEVISNKRIDAQVSHQDKQLAAQVAHWRNIESKAGGDPATKELASLKLAEFKMQSQWHNDLSKAAPGSPERAILLQKGRDFEWIKDAPNDTTTATKTLNDDGSETTVTTKGQAQKKKGKTGWDSTTGDVYRDGVKVGTAKTEVDARSLAAGIK